MSKAEDNLKKTLILVSALQYVLEANGTSGKKRKTFKRNYDPFRDKSRYMRIEELLVELGFFDERYKYIPVHGHQKEYAMILRVLYAEGFCKEGKKLAELMRHMIVQHDCPKLDEELYRKDDVLESKVRKKLHLPQKSITNQPKP